jgi:hypothetical protein
MRTIEIARAKLHKKDTARMCQKLFGMYDGMTIREICEMMYSVSDAPTAAAMQVNRLLSIVANLNAKITDLVAHADTQGESAAAHSTHTKTHAPIAHSAHTYPLEVSRLDLKLPSLSVCEIDSKNARILVAVANAAIRALCATDATALGIARVKVAEFVCPSVSALPNADNRVVVSANTPGEIDRLHELELSIAQHVRRVESVLCALVNHVADVLDAVYAAIGDCGDCGDYSKGKNPTTA